MLHLNYSHIFLKSFALFFFLLKEKRKYFIKPGILGNTIWFIIYPLEEIEKNSLFFCNAGILPLPSSTVKFWPQNFRFDLRALILITNLLTFHECICCALVLIIYIRRMAPMAVRTILGSSMLDISKCCYMRSEENREQRIVQACI